MSTGGRRFFIFYLTFYASKMLLATFPRNLQITRLKRHRQKDVVLPCVKSVYLKVACTAWAKTEAVQKRITILTCFYWDFVIVLYSILFIVVLVNLKILTLFSLPAVLFGLKLFFIETWSLQNQHSTVSLLFHKSS